MTKKNLLNETTIRRWGKLANIAPLTENFIDTLEEEEDEMAAAEEPAEAGEEGGEDMEAGGEEASPEMEAQVEDIVSAVVDALAQETGVDIEMDAGGDDEGGEEEAAEELDLDLGDGVGGGDQLLDVLLRTPVPPQHLQQVPEVGMSLDPGTRLRSHALVVLGVNTGPGQTETAGHLCVSIFCR